MVVLIVVFKVLKFERTEADYFEIKRRKTANKTLFRNKKINPNYRIKYLKEWDVSVEEVLENKNKKRTLEIAKIVKLDNFSRTR